MAAAVRTRGLTKRYGDVLAVDDLDLVVEEGEIFGLLGPNGAGKTTTILMLLGLSEPTDGVAEVVGLDPTRGPLEVKRRVGYLPDNVGFYDQLSGRENLRYTARLNRIPPKEAEKRIAALIGEVGLVDRADDRVRHYSRGMRQRLGIADALVKEPDIVVLDEPTVAIDPAGVEDMLVLIRNLPAQRGVTVLLASHLLDQVQAVCDRIGIFVAGRLVAQGTLQELTPAGGSSRVVVELQVIGEDPEPVLATVKDVLETRRDGGLWVVTAAHDIREQLVQALAAHGCTVVHLRLRGHELGELYRSYFQEAIDGDG